MKKNETGAFEPLNGWWWTRLENMHVITIYDNKVMDINLNQIQ